jgi:hypothetical protein
MKISYFIAGVAASLALVAGEAVVAVAFEAARLTGLTEETVYSLADWGSPLDLLQSVMIGGLINVVLIGSAWKIWGAIIPVLRQERTFMFVVRGVLSSLVGCAVLIALVVQVDLLQWPSELNASVVAHAIIVITICALAGVVWGVVFQNQTSFDKILEMHHDR